MKIIVLENCPGCHILQSRHPEIPSIEIPRKSTPGDSEVLNTKKALGKLGVTEFPVILNDEMTELIDIASIDPEFAASND